MPEGDTLKLLHELQLHQVELAQQNEELKQTRAELEASVERYFGLYELAPVGLVTLHRRGVVRELNRYGQALLCDPGNSLVGKSLTEYLTGTGRIELERALTAPEAGPVSRTVDIVVATPARGERVLRAEMRPHPEANDCFLVALTDITEQHRARIDLAHTREVLEMSNQVARIGYWQFDLVARSWTLSAVAGEIFDMPQDHPRDDIKEISAFCKDDQGRERLRAAQLDAVERGRTFDLELQIITCSGRERWIRFTGRAEARGNPERRLHGTVQDIDAQVSATNARLAQARAEMANRSKNTFLSRMSHDLRTPLNAVLGFSELLQLNSVVSSSPAVAAQVRHIHTAGAHLLAMIDRVLDLTGIESGDLRIAMETIEPTALLAECVALVAPLALSRTVTLRLRQPERPLHVICDRTRLRQVLVNLLSNAVKYDREGGSVDIELAERAGLVAISVRDTGPGLSTAELGQLFEPFNRLGAEHRGIEGTGLGLVIAKQLVEAMGGTIDAESSPGAGSVFTVHLRRAAAMAPDQPRGAHAQTPSTAPRSNRPFVVLYVEDNPVNVELMRATLDLRQRVRLEVAIDGQEGLEMARRLRPDLVLLDMDLPILDGPAVLAHLRADPIFAGIPCVAVSANAMPSDVRQALDTGFDEYIVKPFDVESVLLMLDRMMARPVDVTN